MSKHNSKVSYDLDTKHISAARKLKAAPKTSEGDFAKAFEKAGNFGDKLNVIGKFSIGRTDLYSVILDINKDIKADLEDADNVKRLIQSLYVSALINFKFIPKIHEELRGYVPTEFQILERQIHHDPLTVEQKMDDILARLGRLERQERLSFEQLIDKASRPEIITTFMALLELVRKQFIVFYQAEALAPIEIEKIDGVE